MSTCFKDFYDYELVEKCSKWLIIRLKSNFHKNKYNIAGSYNQCKLYRKRYFNEILVKIKKHFLEIRDRVKDYELKNRD